MDTVSLICIAIAILFAGIFSGFGISQHLFQGEVKKREESLLIIDKLEREVTRLESRIAFIKSLFDSPPKAFIHQRIRTRFDVKEDRVTTRLRLKEDEARKTYEGDVVFQLGDIDKYVYLRDIQALSVKQIIDIKNLDLISKTVQEL